MSEIGDYFKDLKNYEKDKRDEYISSTMESDIKKVLTLCDSYKEHSIYHLTLVKGSKTIDYWPTRKRWIQRLSKNKGFSIESLIKNLKEGR